MMYVCCQMMYVSTLVPTTLHDVNRMMIALSGAIVLVQFYIKRTWHTFYNYTEEHASNWLYFALGDFLVNFDTNQHLRFYDDLLVCSALCLLSSSFGVPGRNRQDGRDISVQATETILLLPLSHTIRSNEDGSTVTQCGSWSPPKPNK